MLLEEIELLEKIDKLDIKNDYFVDTNSSLMAIFTFDSLFEKDDILTIRIPESGKKSFLFVQMAPNNVDDNDEEEYKTDNEESADDDSKIIIGKIHYDRDKNKILFKGSIVLSTEALLSMLFGSSGVYNRRVIFKEGVDVRFSITEDETIKHKFDVARIKYNKKHKKVELISDYEKMISPEFEDFLKSVVDEINKSSSILEN